MYYNGMFESASFILPGEVYKVEDIDSKLKLDDDLKAILDDGDLLCKEILYHEQKYVVGDLVIVDVIDVNHFSIGLIQTILFRKNNIYLVVKKYAARRNQFGYFVSHGEAQSNSVMSLSKLVDFKPLVYYGTVTKF